MRRCRLRRQVSRLDDDVRVDGLRTCDVAGLEPLNEIDFLATDKADLARLALQPAVCTDEE